MRWTHPVIGGVIAGTLTVAAYLVAYSVAPEAYLHRGLHWGTLLIYLVVMYVATQAAYERGSTEFRELVRAPFITYLVANLIFYLFNDVMTQVIDPSLHTSMVDALLEQREDAVASQFDYTLAGTLLAYFQSAIIGFVLAAGISYIFSSKST